MAIFELLDYIVNEVGVASLPLPGCPEVVSCSPCWVRVGSKTLAGLS